MAGEDKTESPPLKRTRSGKAKNKAATHDISSEESDTEGEQGKGMQNDQMQQFADILSKAMGSALASVTNNLQYQNAPQQLPPKSKEDGGLDDKQEESEEEGNKTSTNEDDEVDEYDRSIGDLIGNEEKLGPDISEKIGRVLERCLDPVLDEKVAKEKRSLFPRPGNVTNLAVPRLNNVIYKKITQERQWADRSLQQIQSFLVAGITAIAYEAEHAMKLRSWFSALKEEEKEELPPEMARLGKSYVTMMDASLLFTRTMGEITLFRRKLVKNDLVEPYKSVFDDDKNPATPSWLAGDDVNAAIRKAKDSAALADKITARGPWPSSWPNSGRKRTFSNDRKGFRAGGSFGDFRARQGGQRQDFTPRGRGRGNPSSARGRSDHRDDRRDFQRRDSR